MFGWATDIFISVKDWISGLFSQMNLWSPLPIHKLWDWLPYDLAAACRALFTFIVALILIRLVAALLDLVR